MILIGVAAELGWGLPTSRLAPELELAFGGPIAGAGSSGAGPDLGVHLLHGIVLGIVLAGLLAIAERSRLASAIPSWASGLGFGAAVSAVVLALLAASAAAPLTTELIGLVCLIHVAFGTLAGATLQALCDGRIPGRPRAQAE